MILLSFSEQLYNYSENEGMIILAQIHSIFSIKKLRSTDLNLLCNDVAQPNESAFLFRCVLASLKEAVSVCQSVSPSVRWSVRNTFVKKSKIGKSS